tara:strand:+ start:293 stop:1024 length:732 start_codon:yes stop_codon:yes gene_type:complete
MIKLISWFGRLGNNIIQLSNMIDIALTYKHAIKFRISHRLFNIKIIEDYFSKYNNSDLVTDKYNFYYKNKLPYLNETYQLHSEERNKILKEAFLIKNIEKLHEDDLIIHIRSGDIFSSFPHSRYVPPPLSYYIKQINKRNYRKIIIVCEDNINPVVNHLLGLYKNAIYSKNNLEKDIRLILGATNIIFSVGTFIPSLVLVSDNIKYLYGGEFGLDELQDYYKIMLPWKNTEKQRNYILTYNYT